MDPSSVFSPSLSLFHSLKILAGDIATLILALRDNGRSAIPSALEILHLHSYTSSDGTDDDLAFQEERMMFMLLSDNMIPTLIEVIVPSSRIALDPHPGWNQMHFKRWTDLRIKSFEGFTSRRMKLTLLEPGMIGE